MPSRESFSAGEVVVVPFPYTDLRSSKVRPALVLSRAAFNDRSPDIILCAITSKLVNSEHSVLIDDEDMAEGKLVKPSRVKVANLATVEKAVIRAKVGRLKTATLARVMREFDSLF